MPAGNCCGVLHAIYTGTSIIYKICMNIINRFGDSVIGVQNFFALAQGHASGSNLIRCPCWRCLNDYCYLIITVEEHLFGGIDQNYTHWIFHGENDDFPMDNTNNCNLHSMDTGE